MTERYESRGRPRYRGAVVKKALVISLVVVVMVTGLPVLMGMSGMAGCHDCGEAVVSMVCALAVLAAGMALVLLLAGARLRLGDDLSRPRRHAFLLERPPRLA